MYNCVITTQIYVKHYLESQSGQISLFNKAGPIVRISVEELSIVIPKRNSTFYWLKLK